MDTKKLSKFIILGQSLKHFTQHFGTRKSKAIMNNEQILCKISMPETNIEQDGSNPSNEVSTVDPDQTHPIKFPLLIGIKPVRPPDEYAMGTGHGHTTGAWWACATTKLR